MRTMVTFFFFFFFWVTGELSTLRQMMKDGAEISVSGSSALLTKVGLLIWIGVTRCHNSTQTYTNSKTAHKPEAMIEVH